MQITHLISKVVSRILSGLSLDELGSQVFLLLRTGIRILALSAIDSWHSKSAFSSIRLDLMKCLSFSGSRSILILPSDCIRLELGYSCEPIVDVLDCTSLLSTWSNFMKRSCYRRFYRCSSEPILSMSAIDYSEVDTISVYSSWRPCASFSTSFLSGLA